MAESNGMKRRDLVLLIVSECEGRRGFGRTSLQKVAFFTEILLGRDLGFRAHFYGPYSDEVQSDVEALVLSGLVDEKVYSFGYVSAAGFPVQRYEYSLSDEGRSRLEALRDRGYAEVDEIAKIVGSIDDVFGGLEPRILSTAAKTLFVAREENRPLSTGEIRSIGKDLGWEIENDEIERMSARLEKLGVVKIQED